MHFIKGLSTSKSKETIFVVVDRLTKYGHFVALSHLFTTIIVAQEYLNNIYKLHGVPESIVYNRDNIFIYIVFARVVQKTETFYNLPSRN